jgi:hypothetical protein
VFFAGFTMSLLHRDEPPEAGVNGVLAFEGHWLDRLRVNGLKYGCLDQSNHHSVGMSSDSCDLTAEVSRADPGRQI